MRIVYFTKYSRKGASSRLRSYNYEPYLQKEAYEARYFQLFDDDYLNQIYNKQKVNLLKIARYYLRRIYHLFFVKKSDFIIIEKELFPYLPSTFEWALKKLGYCYAVDIDDAIFHNYDLNSNNLIRKLLSNKIDAVFRMSSLVIAGNSYLASRAKNAGASIVKIIPTVIDLSRYEPSIATSQASKKITVGWIGSPSSTKYLLSIIDVLSLIKREYDVEFHFVGAAKEKQLEEIGSIHPWSEDSEVECIKKFDIGIMPIEDTPWELGKCAYKIIQYFGCAVPTVASSIGANKEVVHSGKNGYLAENKNDWIKHISTLIENPKIRKQIGTAGRETVKKKYCIEAVFNQYLTAITTMKTSCDHTKSNNSWI